jgi:hypothetical protein
MKRFIASYQHPERALCGQDDLRPEALGDGRRPQRHQRIASKLDDVASMLVDNFYDVNNNSDLATKHTN